MGLDYCVECRTHHFTYNGKRDPCKPAFRVWQDDEPEDDAIKLRTFDAEEAATQWADDYDCEGDYTIVSGSEITVHVRDEAGHETKWIVSGESVPAYYARQTK